MKPGSFIKLTLSFSLLTQLIFVIVSASAGQPANWLLPIFRTSIYILLGLFILTASSSLADYNIDSISLFLFLLFGTVFRVDTISNSGFAIILRVVVWIISGLILFKIIRKEIPWSPPERSIFLWMAIALLAGIVFSLLVAYNFIQASRSAIQVVNPPQYTTLSFLVKSLAHDASNTAIPEEFIFRGLLLGQLIKWLGNGKTAYVLQGVIFWLFHFPRLFNSPTEFWFILPVGTLIFSLLVWRTKSLTPAIVAHTALDTFSAMFVVVLVSQ